MSESQNPEFGRKIFFLNPSYKIRNHIITELRENEYEVYEIESYKYAKNILRHNPDSILLLNTDSQLNLPAWVAFIRTFSEDKLLKNIKIGLLSERIEQENADLIFDAADIEAGITSISGDLTKVLEIIKSILDMHGAKGRRNYVRYSCVNDKTAQMFWSCNDKMHQFKILDISSATLAARIPSTLSAQLTEGFVLYDAQIVLGTRVISMNLETYLFKETPHGKIVIFLYDSKTTPANLKTMIKIFISQSLQKHIISAINNEAEDTADYITMAKQDSLSRALEEVKTHKKTEKNTKKNDSDKSDESDKSDTSDSSETPDESEHSEEPSTTAEAEDSEESVKSESEDKNPESEENEETSENKDNADNE